MLSFADFALPTGATVTDATLEFFTKSSSPGPINFYQLAVPFDASTTTNSLGPNQDGLFVPGVIEPGSPVGTASNIADETPISVDVTGIVSNWAGGAPSYGFGIYNQSGDGWDIQVVTDGDEFSPRLVVGVEQMAPIPLPAPALLLIAGLAGIAALRRRA